MQFRYQRHNLIDWYKQDKVQNARIVVVGAGAVGNEVLKNLALLGVGYIHIIDFDKIEEHNLTRCVLFRESDIGKYKAEVAAKACLQIDSNINVMVSCDDFWDSLSLKELLETDAVICCVDNFEARIRLNQLCMIADTDFYNTGIDSRYVSVEIHPFSTSPDCACYECTLPMSVYSSIQKRYSCGWLRKVAFEEKKIPTTAVTSSLAAAYVVSMVLNKINEHPQAIQTSVRLFLDSITLAITQSVLLQNEDCLTCKSFSLDKEIITAKRSDKKLQLIPFADKMVGEVLLSEQVLLRGICKLCGREQEYFETSRKLSDSIMFCSLCGSYSVESDFVERLTITDFENTFAGRPIPCKFVSLFYDNHQIIIELED